MKRTKHIVAALLVALAGSAHAGVDAPEMKNVSPKEFLKLSKEKGAVIFDVRDDSDPRTIVLDSAIAMPAATLSNEKVAAVAPDKTAPMLLLCNFSLMPSSVAIMSRKASATSLAARDLAEYGYRRIYVLKDADTKEAAALLNLRTTTKEQN